MEREVIGRKVLEHLSIQGEIEGTKQAKVDLKAEIGSNEVEIKRLESLKVLTGEMKTRQGEVSKKQVGLEAELKGLDEELKSAGVTVPGLVTEEGPSNIKF